MRTSKGIKSQAGKLIRGQGIVTYAQSLSEWDAKFDEYQTYFGMPACNTKLYNWQRTQLSKCMLDECINALGCEWKKTGGRPPPLPPVLCHVDLQPQNLAFKRDHDRNCFVASVMDWEEACYADPRFELLLICRKVLANREQAETMWQSYSVFVQQFYSSLSLKTKMEMQLTIGDIEPWLKLETVHSICMLSLQAMDLLGVGRSPWETKLDLWGKIARERQRLVQMGWLFCDSDCP